MNDSVRQPTPLSRSQVQDILLQITLPPVTHTQLAFYCAATAATDPIHYDVHAAREHGFADVVVNGSLRVAWLTNAAVDLAQAPARLESISCKHRRVMLVGQRAEITARLVERAASEDGAELLTIALENRVDGTTCDTAEAQIRLPPPQG